MRSFRLLVMAFGLAASLLPSSASAADKWKEVRSPHFRVITNGSAGDARNVAAQFEQMRHVFTVLFKREDIDASAPLTIVAARDLDTFRSLDPRFAKWAQDNIAGLFFHGWERQYALIRLDTFGEQNQVVVFHEYAHSILHANTHWLPTWLDEGLAEFYGYTRFERDKTYVGAPSIRLGHLKNATLIPISTMLTVEPEVRYHNDRDQLDLYYAESWAMVHFMQFGPGMENGHKLITFMHLLDQQTPEQEAFRQVFGDPAAFEKALSLYLMRFAFSAGVLPADPRINPRNFDERDLSPAETDDEIGCFRVGLHDFPGALEMIEQALQLDPKLAPAHEELGFLDFDRGQDEAARKEWQQAVALDPNLPRSRFALLMTGKPIPQQSLQELMDTENALREINGIAPHFAAPFAEVALIEWRLRQIQRAYNDAATALKLEPWRAGYRILTGQILLHGNQPALAASLAVYAAGHWYGPDRNEAVDLYNAIPAAKRGTDAPPTFQYPAGAQVERGTLTALSCAKSPGGKMHFTVLSDGPNAVPRDFVASDRIAIGFSDTLWWGEDHFNPCYHVTGLPVVVAYQPASGGSPAVAEELDIRDVLPSDANPSTAAGPSSPATAASTH